MNDGVSVIICCYNSLKRLSKTLEHLAYQNVPFDISWEIIIVDNNSTDNTAAVAREEWRKCNINVPFKVGKGEIHTIDINDKVYEIVKKT